MSIFKSFRSARSNTSQNSSGNRGLRRSIARAAMEDADIQQINRKIKQSGESRYRSKFARLWRAITPDTYPLHRIGKKGCSKFISRSQAPNKLDIQKNRG